MQKWCDSPDDDRAHAIRGDSARGHAAFVGGAGLFKLATKLKSTRARSAHEQMKQQMLLGLLTNMAMTCHPPQGANYNIFHLEKPNLQQLLMVQVLCSPPSAYADAYAQTCAHAFR